MRIVENIFEYLLFNSRFLVLFAVLGAIFSSVIMFIRGTMKIANTAIIFWRQITGAQNAAHGSDTLVALFVSSVDIYLFATVLLIFSTGLYDLFISKAGTASRHKAARPQWMQVSSLDDLKSSLGKVILMILVVWFFEQSLIVEYHSALDLLYLGLGILLVAGALYLTQVRHGSQTHYPGE